MGELTQIVKRSLSDFIVKRETVKFEDSVEIQFELLFGGEEA
jgi:hypothetical protein